MPELPPEACISRLLHQADRLGVAVRWLPADHSQQPQGTYQALPNRPGVIELRQGENPAPSAALCQLLTHEMVHVLQHWQADWKAVLPLGWPRDGTATQQRSLSPHEAEAFTAQEQPRKVLKALSQLAPIPQTATQPARPALTP